MIDRDYWSHDTPDGVRFDVLIRSHNNYRSVGENIAKCYTGVETTMAGWKASPAHNSNMLDVRWLYIGIGEYKGECMLTVTHFGG